MSLYFASLMELWDGKLNRKRLQPTGPESPDRDRKYFHISDRRLRDSPKLLDVEQEVRVEVQEEVSIKQGPDSFSEEAKEKTACVER
ncbi:hypothetical protein N7461_006815 [Penicillium sp. DV-2018c]|nr:hypothetical protein N7461_006815 [Penicillium sp. DV-2018c]